MTELKQLKFLWATNKQSQGGCMETPLKQRDHQQTDCRGNYGISGDFTK